MTVTPWSGGDNTSTFAFITVGACAWLEDEWCEGGVEKDIFSIGAIICRDFTGFLKVAT